MPQRGVLDALAPWQAAARDPLLQGMVRVRGWIGAMGKYGAKLEQCGAWCKAYERVQRKLVAHL